MNQNSEWGNRLVCAIGRLPIAVASQAHIAGLEHLPGGGCLLAVNHTHYYDCMLVMAACPRPIHWLSATEVSEGPWRAFMRFIGTIPLRRGIRDTRATRRMLGALRDGAMVGVFPEGRIRRGEERVTHSGTIDESLCRLARAAQVPIIPCAVCGCERFTRWHAWLPLRRTRWAVVFGPPLEPAKQETAALVAGLRTAYADAARAAA